MVSTHRTADGSVPAEALIDANLLKEVLDCVEDGVCLLDTANHVLYWNHGAEQITGHLAHEVAGRHCSEQLELCSDCDGAPLSDGVCALSHVKDDGKPRESLVYVRHRLGHRIPVRMRAQAIRDAEGKITGVVEVFARASAQGRTELARAARHRGHDELTGAVTREYGLLRIKQELEAVRGFGLVAAWIRVDVLGVEELRKRFGPGMIDAVMKLVAHTIDANLNSFDGLILWDATSFRVMVRHAESTRVKELARKLEVMVHSERVEWWGEKREVKVAIASVMATGEDTVTTLEERVAQEIAAVKHRRCGDGCSCS